MSILKTYLFMDVAVYFYAVMFNVHVTVTIACRILSSFIISTLGYMAMIVLINIIINYVLLLLLWQENCFQF